MKVSWEKETEQSPYHMPPLFGGSRFLVFGYLPKGAAAGSATLTAQAGPNTFKSTVKYDPSTPVTGNMIVALAAKSMIR